MSSSADVQLEPLHVQVARALGCAPQKYDEYAPKNGQPVWWVCPCRLAMHSIGAVPNNWLPDYDTDWAAAGPLIERYGISVLKDETGDPRQYDPRELWSAHVGVSLLGAEYGLILDDDMVEYAEAPLTAVCRLLIAMSKAGKL